MPPRKYIVKRTESLSDSKRFLDSTSRISSGNPLLNKKKIHVPNASSEASFSDEPFSNNINISDKKKYLVIVESPSKCKKIEGFLGPNYQCIASKGHLREIEGLKSIDTKGDYTITFTNTKEKEAHIEFMRKVIAGYTFGQGSLNPTTNSVGDIRSPEEFGSILLATDDDREGEAIAWHICDIFGLPVDTTPRILFHEITQPALLAAVAAPIRVRMNIVKAQHARQILDMLVGFKISPYLWKYLYNNKSASLSAGRCQTPALRLIYDNQQEINQKTLEVKYNTTGYFFSQHIAFQLNHSYEKTEDMSSFLELSRTFQHKIHVGYPKESTKSAPRPLNTSRLLQVASNTLHLSPKQTMMYCQQLYQDGHITYMRTDSMIYSKEFVGNAFQHIEKTWGSQYYCKKRDKIENQTNNNPHEAIRITHIELSSVSYPKDPKIETLYRLIWKNTLESCMSDATFNCTTISITAPNLSSEHRRCSRLEPSVPTDDRRSSTKLVVGCKAPLPLENAYQHVLEVPIFLGWKIIQNKENVSENPSTNKFVSEFIANPSGVLYTPHGLSSNQNNVGGNLLFFKSIESAGSPIQYNKIESKTVIQHKHSHYTESSLIQKLEELGIGRPSTFSMLVETIQDRGYVKKMDVVGEEIECIDFVVENQVVTQQKINKVFGNEKNKLVIQPIGILTTEFLVSSFSTLFDYEYTKHMEDALDLISNNENGNIQLWSEICIKCNNEIKQLAKTMNSVEKKTYKINDEYTLVFMKNGPVLIKTLENGTTEFANVVKDIQLNLDKLSRNEYIIDDLLEMKQIILGKHEDNDVILKNGKYGPYIEWTILDKGTEIMRTSVKHIQKPFHLIELGDVLSLIVKNGDDARAPPNAPNKAVIRIIDENTSIRKGKFGAYVYYKTEHMKSPQFFNMSKFKKGYDVCDLQDIKDWLKNTHNI